MKKLVFVVLTTSLLLMMVLWTNSSQMQQSLQQVRHMKEHWTRTVQFRKQTTLNNPDRF